MDVHGLAAAIDEVTRASTALYSNGQSEHVTIPRPLRGLLKWQKREPLIVILENEHSVRVVSLRRYMEEVIEADRRARTVDDTVPR
jgi:bifunctional DNA-binding transcriptional regulator/antitoxin component of YhaV-PrlF toxin-antitoxin module